MLLARRTHEGRRPPHVIIVGAGFGGLYAARSLRRAPVEVTVVDSRNHHVFQPLLLSSGDGGAQPERHRRSDSEDPEASKQHQGSPC